MTGAEIAQIILALATLITASGGVWVSLRNSRKLDGVHRAVKKEQRDG